jgi:hypothetical protein
MTRQQGTDGGGAAAVGPSGRHSEGAPVAEGGMRVPRLGVDAAAVAAAPKGAWRRDTEERKRAYARRHGVDLSALRTEHEVDRVLESVIALPDFLPSRWIRRAAAVADGVARIRTPRSFWHRCGCQKRCARHATC